MVEEFFRFYKINTPFDILNRKFIYMDFIKYAMKLNEKNFLLKDYMITI